MKFKIEYFFIISILFSAQFALAAPSVSVAFVLDESGSVSNSNFQLETQGFINALNGLPIDGSVEVSIIGFSSSSEVLQSPIELTSSNLASVKSKLENNSQYDGGTNMSDAINTASNLLSSSSAPTKVICMATDGSPRSSFNTTSSANSAKNSGITLTPVGIGLGSSGKTFLDSIASNPPVANPNDFNEFSTVVRNVCVGVVDSALNIHLSPDPVDFGTFNSASIVEDAQICAKDPKVIGVANASNKIASITKLEIIGQDAANFKLISFMFTDATNLTYPIKLSPQFLTQAKVLFEPVSSPLDQSYDAVLKITGEDVNGVSAEFSTALVAKSDLTNPGCLKVDVNDASPIVHHLSDSGAPLKKDSSSVGEIDIAIALKNDKDKKKLYRKGLVTDGNARLLLTAKTKQVSGKVKFEIMNPSLTESKLYAFNSQPTYKPGTREYDTNGATTITLDIIQDSDSNGQITAVLRAGERFLGTGKQVEYKIKACILDSSNACEVEIVPITIIEKRAPVVLIHGLWANGSSWFGSSWGKKIGVQPKLEENENFRVGFLNYDDRTMGFGTSEFSNSGPTRVMPPKEARLSNAIKGNNRGLCHEIVEKDKLSCTRADVVAHSMGGLVTKKYLYDNETYKSNYNYNQGSIRRFITLATPHDGSALANLLLTDNASIGGCLRDDNLITDGIQNTDLQEAISALLPDRTIYGGAIRDLTISNNIVNSKYGSLVETLNSNKHMVPFFPIIGNIGSKFNLGPVSSGAFYVVHQIGDAGCNYFNVFGNESGDGIVPITSAQGGETLINEEFSDIAHVGMGEKNSVGDKVVELLNGDINSFSFDQ